jgi:hypothetical protein
VDAFRIFKDASGVGGGLGEAARGRSWYSVAVSKTR